MSDPNVEEARRRIKEAARLVESAIRLGGDPEYVRGMMATAGASGAEQYAADVVWEYERAGA